MNIRSISLLLGLCLFLMTAFAGAQTWSDEQLEVWQTIKSEWEMSKSKDSDRLNRLLHEKFLGWGNADPAPRNRASVVMWDRFNNETNSTLVYELYPLGIVVHKDTAVAHYLYSMAVEDQEGERETESGRYTDILVKDGGQWKFLAWSGGITDSEDD